MWGISCVPSSIATVYVSFLWFLKWHAQPVSNMSNMPNSLWISTVFSKISPPPNKIKTKNIWKQRKLQLFACWKYPTHFLGLREEKKNIVLYISVLSWKKPCDVTFGVYLRHTVAYWPTQNLLHKSLNAKCIAGILKIGDKRQYAASTTCTDLMHTHFQCFYQNTDSPLWYTKWIPCLC